MEKLHIKLSWMANILRLKNISNKTHQANKCYKQVRILKLLLSDTLNYQIKFRVLQIKFLNKQL